MTTKPADHRYSVSAGQTCDITGSVTPVAGGCDACDRPKGRRSHVTGHPPAADHTPMAALMTAPKPAVRARKARRSSRLACGCYVHVGERIIRTPDGRWQCAPCVIAAAIAARADQERTSP